MKALEIFMIAGLAVFTVFLIVMAIQHPDKKYLMDLLSLITSIMSIFSD